MHDAVKMGLADHAADEAGAEDVALRLARDIARVRGCLPAALLLLLGGAPADVALQLV